MNIVKYELAFLFT